MIEAAIVTPIPSPYQVEFWDAVATDGRIKPRVVYVERTHQDRCWQVPAPGHDNTVLEDGVTSERVAANWVASADLVVIAWYVDSRSRRLMNTRAKSGRPWVYWGERPGFSKLRIASRVRRWWWLSALRRSNAPIWGIGEWAIKGWRSEFGHRRPYVNFPYFSDLSRFDHRDPSVRASVWIRFLYCGSLTHRKGVDILARAFSSIAADRPGVSIEFVGTGELEASLRSDLASFTNRVRFSGFAQWNELPAAYARADVLVAPSRHDGWGLIVPEGLASGLPVIATDQMGAARDLICPGVNGWLVPAGDFDRLKTTMAEAADLSGDRLMPMANAARQSVANHQLADGVERFVLAARTAIGIPTDGRYAT